MKSQVGIPIAVAFLATTPSWAQIPDELLSAARSVVPVGLSEDQLSAMLEDGVSQPNGDALAVLIPQPAASKILVFVPQPDGTFVAADASVVESWIFGGLGRPRTDYERYESEILELQQRDDGYYSLHVRTRAWRMGQRYTHGGDILVRPDGMVMQ